LSAILDKITVDQVKKNAYQFRKKAHDNISFIHVLSASLKPENMKFTTQQLRSNALAFGEFPSLESYELFVSVRAFS